MVEGLRLGEAEINVVCWSKQIKRDHLGEELEEVERVGWEIYVVQRDVSDYL